MRRKHAFVLLLTGVFFLSCAQSRQNKNKFEWGEIAHKPDFSWTENIGSRQLPDSTIIVSANTFGAIADSTVLSTDAIQ